jgi:hypothetical protein
MLIYIIKIIVVVRSKTYGLDLTKKYQLCYLC